MSATRRLLPPAVIEGGNLSDAITARGLEWPSGPQVSEMLRSDITRSREPQEVSRDELQTNFVPEEIDTYT